MGSILEKAKAHYQEKLSAEPRRLDVPEWDSVVYVKPTMNLARMGEILELTNQNKTAEAMALTLCYRLVDEKGQPVFHKAERLELLRTCDPDVLSRLVSEVNSDQLNPEDVSRD